VYSILPHHRVADCSEFIVFIFMLTKNKKFFIFVNQTHFSRRPLKQEFIVSEAVLLASGLSLCFCGKLFCP